MLSRSGVASIVTIGLLALPSHVWPAQSLDQHHVMVWTAFDDSAAASVWAMAQDREGALWLGLSQGLMRFDGARFLRWEPRTGPALPRYPVMALWAARDGSLWIGFGSSGGVSRLADGVLYNYTSADGLPEGAILTLLEDRDGTIWAGGYYGVARFYAGRWERLNARHGMTAPISVFGLYEDRAGTLWLGSESDVFRWNAEKTTLVRSQPPFRSLGSSSDVVNRSIWVTSGHRSFRMHDRVLHDRQGDVWFGTRGDGLLHVRSRLAQRPEVERFTRLAGLTSDRVLSLLEDRDGNIWIGTESGLVCVTLSLSLQLERRFDLGRRAVHVVVATRDGSVWTGTADGLNRSTREGSRWFFKRDGLPSNVINALHEDTQGTLWVATDKGVARFTNGRFAPVAISRRPGTERVIAIASDTDGGLWLCEYEGLRRFKDGVVSNVSDPPEVAGRTPIAAYTDSRGRVWIGFLDGGVTSIHNGTFQAYSPGSGLAGKPVGAIYEDSTGAVWVGAYGGLSKYEQGRFTTLTRDKGLPWESVRTIVEDVEHHLWLMTESGLVRFDPREFDRAVRDPSSRIRYRLFDKSDGVDGFVWAGSPMSARTIDGKVAFVTSSGMVVLDPARLRTPSPPPVQIERVYADERSFLPASPLRLPPRTTRLQIDYSGISLLGQSKIRFRYKLEGFDEQWIDVGHVRRASYTNLGPRDYRFRVAVSYNGSEWSDSRDLAFSIRPAFYQTTAFYVSCVAGLVFATWAVWRRRLQQLRKEYSLVLSERARLAREIHDTLLQDMVGAVLQVHGVATMLQSAPDPARRALQRVVDHLEHSIRETRFSIWDLRSPTLETRELATALREAGETLTEGTGVSFDLVVRGRPSHRHPKVDEHVLRIAREAITNALKHADPTRIHIELVYGNGLMRLRVSDNGHGVDGSEFPDVAGSHWGLKSMHERAQQIGGQLKFLSTSTAGTEIEVVLEDAYSS